MKRLLRVGLNTLLQSLIPILCWFLLGLIVDMNLVNVFAITCPIQFLFVLIKKIFGTGANIKQTKENNINAVWSGITLGAISGAILLGILCPNVSSYLQFMNVDVAIFKTFAIYSFIQMYISLIFQMVIEKLYFEDRDRIATLHTILYNTLNVVVLTLCAFITKTQWIIAISSLVTMSIYTIGMLVCQFNKFKLEFNVLSNIKYIYIIAINFVTLITDSQWDACETITTVAKIDIASEKFNLKTHLKNGIIFVGMLVTSFIVAFFALFRVYNVDFEIGLYYMLFQSADFVLGLCIYIVGPYIQLKYSAFKNLRLK